MDITTLPWLAVVAATAAYFVLGAVWYGAFATPWMRYTGTTEEKVKEGAGPTPYLIAFVASLVGATATALVIQATGATTLPAALGCGLLLGVGVVASAIAKHSAFQGHALGLYLIDAGYDVVGYLAMAVIISLLA